LGDLVDLLAAQPEGQALLQSAERGDSAAVQAAIAALADRPDLPERLLHHLALLELRTARALEEKEQTEAAAPHWKQSWRFWLRWLPTAPQGSDLLLDHLLGLHRRRVVELMARDAVPDARRHTELVHGLPALAGANEPLQRH